MIWLSSLKKKFFREEGFLISGKRTTDFQELWGKEAKHYYIHGKDNIPFHTIILPALLLGHSENWHLPDSIISSEYLTLEGRKISTSQNYAIWVKDLLRDYEADSIRYFFLANGPAYLISFHIFIDLKLR